MTFCLTAHYRQAEKLLQRHEEMARLWTLLEAETARRDLRALVDAGLLVPHGERRGRHYVASEWLRQARDSTRAATVTTDPFTDEVGKQK